MPRVCAEVALFSYILYSSSLLLGDSGLSRPGVGGWCEQMSAETPFASISTNMMATGLRLVFIYECPDMKTAPQTNAGWCFCIQLRHPENTHNTHRHTHTQCWLKISFNSTNL